MSKPAPIEVRRVQVRELRAGFKSLREEGKPVLVMRNGHPCAVVLLFPGGASWWRPLLESEKKLLRDGLDAALAALTS
jgi:hypothetical protein